MLNFIEIFRLIGFIFFYIRKIPYVRNKIENELDKMKKFIVKTIHKYDTDKNFIKFLPENPIDFDEIVKISGNFIFFFSFTNANLLICFEPNYLIISVDKPLVD